MERNKSALLFFLYFALSTILTWWFVAFSPLYISNEQMLLSTAVAGGKWAIQVVAGYVLLKERKWEFLRNIAFVCLIGSVILVPYIISSLCGWNASAAFFVGSLAVSVATMIFFYFRAVHRSRVSLNWWFFWLLCLATAVSLQLTVVFNVVHF